MQVTRQAFTAARLAVHRSNAPYPWSVIGSRLQSRSVPPPSWTQRNLLSQCARYNAEGRFTGAAKDPPQESNNSQESEFSTTIAQQKEKQSQAPWHREGSDTPPVARQRSAGAMTKGIDGFRAFVRVLMYHLFRQTPYYPLPPPQTDHPSHNPRPQHRSQGRRTLSPPRPPATTPLVPRAPHPIRTPHRHHRPRRRKDPSRTFPSRRLPTRRDPPRQDKSRQ